jgi:DinB superfamily
MNYSLIIFRQTRQNIFDLTRQLNDGQLMKIPQNRRNNILWNMGHVVAIQQLLLYRSIGLAVGVPEDFITNFKKDTSPQNWESPPDIQEVRKALIDTSKKFLSDFENSLFENTILQMKFKMVFGVTITTSREAILFNNTHEAMHLGIIMSIIKQI